MNTAIDHEGYNALMLAIKYNNIPLINKLLDYGADINQPTSKEHGSKTPLMIAVFYYVSIPAMQALAFSDRMRLPPDSELLIRPDVVKLLLDRGANRNATDSDGKTALNQAIEDGSTAIISLLSDQIAAGGRKSKRRGRMQRRRRRRRRTRKMKHRK